MGVVHISEITSGIVESDFLWILIPIFFIGVITDKYQEEIKTSIGNAISNGALVIFTGFSWLQIINSRENFPSEVLFSQYMFAIMIIIYGFAIIASGFGNSSFAQKYGRIRVITFMLIFFTMMIYVPILYNYISVVLFVLIFPFYYAFITELIKILPDANSKDKVIHEKEVVDNSDKSTLTRLKLKLKEYLK